MEVKLCLVPSVGAGHPFDLCPAHLWNGMGHWTGGVSGSDGKSVVGDPLGGNGFLPGCFGRRDRLARVSLPGIDSEYIFHPGYTGDLGGVNCLALSGDSIYCG